MYYSPDTLSPELRKAILKQARDHNGGVPKEKAISVLIFENKITPENQNIFRQCIDNEIEALVSEGQLTIDNSKTLNLLMLTPLSDLSGIYPE